MPKTALDPGMGVMPVRNSSPEEAMRFQKDYMTALSKRYNGDEAKALAAYNNGMGNVDKAIGKAETRGGNWLSYTPKETQDYVPSVMFRAKEQPSATVPAEIPKPVYAFGETGGGAATGNPMMARKAGNSANTPTVVPPKRGIGRLLTASLTFFIILS